MACAAGDGVGGLAVTQLREVLPVEVVGHPDHDASLLLDRICIGGEVVALGLGVACVAVFTIRAEVALVLTHELDDFVAGDVFGKSLDVGGIGTWTAGPGVLSGSERLLSEREVSR